MTKVNINYANEKKSDVFLWDIKISEKAKMSQ